MTGREDRYPFDSPTGFRALRAGLWWSFSRQPISSFEQGDRIGTSGGDASAMTWLGEVIESEPDPVAGWHLAWIQDDSPGKVYHFRGDSRDRDLRWCCEVDHVISEQP